MIIRAMSLCRRGSFLAHGYSRLAPWPARARFIAVTLRSYAACDHLKALRLSAQLERYVNSPSVPDFGQGQALRIVSARVYAQANDKEQCASPRTDGQPDG